jgi:hypothetical protein
MAAKKTISLRDLRQHVKALDKLVTDAWFNSGHPASISFAHLRKHASAISALVAEDMPSSPRAATAKSSPKAATDKALPFDPKILGLYHIHKG